MWLSSNENQTTPDTIISTYLKRKRNSRMCCLPAGNGPLVTGGTCTNPISASSIPILSVTIPGVNVINIVNASGAIGEISPGVTVTGSGGTTIFPIANALGSFANRLEDNTFFFKLRPNQQFGVITYI